MDWHKHFFDEGFGNYYLSKSRSNEARAEKEVDFLRSVSEGSPILDLDCGAGWHAIRLSVKKETVGLDLSRFLLRDAKKRMVLNTSCI
jgi:SAM-dependent methyltransferase